jgi:HEPN domain-containing protein
MNETALDIQREFEQAQKARANGNEGRARVCARRAAGIAIRDYLVRKGIRPPSRSAHDLLNLIKDSASLPPDLRLVADHLTLRVTEEFKLPIEVDLVAESKSLCDWLMKN